MHAHFDQIFRTRRRAKFFASVLAVALAASLSGAGFVSADEPTTFERAYFLETHDLDYAAAAAMYARLAADSAAVDAVRGEAAERLALCQAELAAADLARLMPADALVYVETQRPGEAIAALAAILGIDGDSTAAASSSRELAIPLDDGMWLPARFQASPALLAELKKVRALAAALRRVSSDGEVESGVVVLHPGESDAIRGALETYLQLLEPAEPIDGLRAYNAEGEAVIVAAPRLIVVGRTRDDAAGVIARLRDPQLDNLAQRGDFVRSAADRDAAGVFVHVGGQALLAAMREQAPPEALAQIESLADLAHLDSLTASVGVDGATLFAQARVRLADDHKNLAYTLLRTGPLTHAALERVPAGAAALAAIGLNPPAEGLPAPASPDSPAAAGLSMARALLSSVEEIAVFAAPAADGAPVPHAGLIIATREPHAAEAVWSQLLGLASLAGGPAATSVELRQLAGHDARRYDFGDLPSLWVARAGDRALVIGTEGGVAASLAIASPGDSALHDDELATIFARLPGSASKAALAHVGRVVAMARGAGFDVDLPPPAWALVANLRGWAYTAEEPASVAARAEATGLPTLEQIVAAIAAARGPAN